MYSSVFIVPDVNDEDSVNIEVPKALGDLFEAVVGAVYVDSGMDLEKVWHVFFPFLKPSIGKCQSYYRLLNNSVM